MDALFKGKVPTDADIKKTKQEYRKYYQKRYRNDYKNKYVQITFRITKDQYLMFQKTAQNKDIKITSLIKKRALLTKACDHRKVKIIISELLDYIEESVYEKKEIKHSKLLEQLELVYQAL